MRGFFSCRPASFFLFLCILFPAADASARSEGIAQEEYAARRSAMLARLDSGSALVMKAAEPRERNNDVNYRYRQESNFLYLTGLNGPGYTLLAIPAGVAVSGKIERILLFHSAAAAGAQDSSLKGVAWLPADRFRGVFDSISTRIQTLYLSAPDARFTYDWLNGRAVFLDREAKKNYQERFPGVTVKPAAGLLAHLRELKSANELSLVRRAIAMTGDGIRKALASCRPEGYEYELQAAVEFEMTRQGADYTSFPCIIGSGPNSLIPHYEDNRRMMKAGELVVMDVGAEYGGYAADITRTIPVSGRFSPAQRTVYDIVLKAHDAIIASVRPGLPVRELDRIAKSFITDSGYGRFILHGVSHQVGIDVHDASVTDTLRTGMIVTVEPGIYIGSSDTTVAPEFRGFGIRIEDDVLVTQNGFEVLSRSVPSSAAEIEQLMRKR